MEGEKIRIKVSVPVNKYSEAFKKQVVREYESGILNKDQLMRKYDIAGKSTVLEWCRKYGNFDYFNGKLMKGRPSNDPQKRRIRELENKLKEAELKIKAYEKIIEITNEELKGDVIKKIGARLSGNWQQNREGRLVLPVDSLASANKPITNPKAEARDDLSENKLP